MEIFSPQLEIKFLGFRFVPPPTFWSTTQLKVSGGGNERDLLITFRGEENALALSPLCFGVDPNLIDEEDEEENALALLLLLLLLLLCVCGRPQPETKPFMP